MRCKNEVHSLKATGKLILVRSLPMEDLRTDQSDTEGRSSLHGEGKQIGEGRQMRLLQDANGLKTREESAHFSIGSLDLNLVYGS